MEHFGGYKVCLWLFGSAEKPGKAVLVFLCVSERSFGCCFGLRLGLEVVCRDMGLWGVR